MAWAAVVRDRAEMPNATWQRRVGRVMRGVTWRRRAREKAMLAAGSEAEKEGVDEEEPQLPTAKGGAGVEEEEEEEPEPPEGQEDMAMARPKRMLPS